MADPHEHANSVDEVLAALGRIVDRCIRRRSRAGYFAKVYLRITERVKAGIASSAFADAAWVEKLDVAFANRYFDAVSAYETGSPVADAWRIAFHSASLRNPIILQHILLGINAHINYDLPLATAAVTPAAELAGHETDFTTVNNFAAQEVRDLRQRLSGVSPLLGLFGELNGNNADERYVEFVIDEARAQAWIAAQSLAYLPTPGQRQELSALLDSDALKLARLVLHPPGVAARVSFALVRAAEVRPVATVIRAL
jgi:hypothetical protein